MTEQLLDGRVTLHGGDCLEILKSLPDCSVDSCVTDPPYHLQSIHKRFAAKGRDETSERYAAGPYGRTAKGFMGKQWDGGDIAFRPDVWIEVLRVLKPGGHLVAFGGTRTYHRMACAIEDAGFEIRDMIGWLYGQGFPKSHDVSKGIDRLHGAEREVRATGKPLKRMIPGADQNKAGWEKNNGRVYVPGESDPATPTAQAWDGWGTALKPAQEPICLARKPLSGTVAQNVLDHGTGALNIDGCRIKPTGDGDYNYAPGDHGIEGRTRGSGFALGAGRLSDIGRWPANVMHDGSDEVVGAFPDAPGAQFAVRPDHKPKVGTVVYGDYGPRPLTEPRNDSGSAARFFYTAKADADDRLGSKHPTVKPLDLMQWLVRLVTPKYTWFCFSCEERAPDETVPGMRETVPTEGQSEEQGQEILQSHLQQPMDGPQSAGDEGVRNLEKGLPADLDAEPPASQSAAGLYLRAPAGGAADDRSASDERRSRPSHKRNQNGQPARKPSIDEEGRTRRLELAKAEHLTLSALRGPDHHESSCPVCGAARLLRRGVVLDPFSGTGTTGEAAWREGFNAALIERETEYQEDIRRRMALCLSGPDERAREAIKAKLKGKPVDHGPLFAPVDNGDSGCAS